MFDDDLFQWYIAWLKKIKPNIKRLEHTTLLLALLAKYLGQVGNTTNESHHISHYNIALRECGV